MKKKVCLMAAMAACVSVFSGCTEDKELPVTSISLDKTTLTLDIGEDFTLTATVLPDDATDKTVTWTSSDPGKATVVDGKVTAVAAGTATITAKAGDKEATCTVTVNDAPAVPVDVTSISLDKPTLTLVVGEDFTLTATVLPDDATDKTVTWESSDLGKATVVDGKVTAVAAGTATITAKAGDKTATCTVTIEAPAELKSFTLKGELKGLKVGMGVNPQKVVVYDNPDFKGSPVGKGTIGGGGFAPSSPRFAARSIGSALRSVGTVAPYDNDAQWEIPLTNIDPNECPQLYFAVTGLTPVMTPFMYPLNDFEVPVTGIGNNDDYDINARLQNNNPFNDGIEIECIMIEGTLKVTGINPGEWPDGSADDWGDLANFGSVGWLMVYDANGAEIGSFLFNDYPHPADELWTEADEARFGGDVVAGEVARPKDIVNFHGMIPARPSTLTFDLGFGDDATGKRRANVTSFSTFNLTAEKITVDENGTLNGIDGIDLGTGDITGVHIPAPDWGAPSW
ncbi:hypothetical protein AGMMS49965_08270 [Bacteroidia bacterium]|nr:hypothetical protein AGMMS49965_08270 [Bacteroidia bacterium]